ncbi:hypothetical protein ACOSQ3_022725 [Xanthoceras sorbifolium]
MNLCEDMMNRGKTVQFRMQGNMCLAYMHEKQVVANSVHALLVLHVEENHPKSVCMATMHESNSSSQDWLAVKKKNCSPAGPPTSNRDLGSSQQLAAAGISKFQWATRGINSTNLLIPEVY